MRENKKIQFSFRISQVTDIEFHIFNMFSYGIQDFENLDDKLFFNYGWQIEANKEAKEVVLIMSIFFMYKLDSDKNVPLVNYYYSTHFLINNFEEVIKTITPESFDIPDEILPTLLSVSISTGRGMLIEKLSKSFYRDIILPIATPEFIQQLVKNGRVNKTQPIKETKK
jgi:hypothetical protein